MSTTTTVNVTETRILLADPTALGIFGLSMVTFVASSQKMGWTTGVTYLVPWALFLGSLAQVWAATVDFRKNNYFGAIVLAVYGLFWGAVATHWAISQGWFGALDPAKTDPRQLAFACIGYFLFSLAIMVVAFEVNKVFAAILVLINVLLPSLALSILGINPGLFSVTAAWSELLISLLGFYAAGAIFMNSFFGRVILPLGKPFGFIRKGAAK
ncbi:MAG: acetate uptake transporter [Syntrophobacteraceae bacterium]